MQRARTLRGAPPRADPARRLGLPDHRERSGSASPRDAGAARGRGLPRACPGAATLGAQEMTTALLGIADDRALGGSMRVIVTHPQTLAAAKAAVDGVVLAIDLAASRFREDSELSRLNAMPDKVVKVSPLLAHAIPVGLPAPQITDAPVDPPL